MLKQILILSLILSWTILGFAVAPSHLKPNPVFTEEKPNIALAKNQPTFTIRLKSNPTTGFSWFLREYDSNLITPVKHQFIKQNTSLMGAPGLKNGLSK